MFVAFYAVVITMVIGSFCMYHIYLISYVLLLPFLVAFPSLHFLSRPVLDRTNQTTLESLSPFLLLRHIPPLPDNADSRKLSNPPLEHELSFEQRVLVREAHRHIRLYDVGFRKNWAQVFGWSRPWGWVYRLLLGGSWCVFPRNLLGFSLFADGSPCVLCLLPLPCATIVLCFNHLDRITNSVGDGKTYPRNPRADEMLNRLASELVSADKDR